MLPFSSSKPLTTLRNHNFYSSKFPSNHLFFEPTSGPPTQHCSTIFLIPIKSRTKVALK